MVSTKGRYALRVMLDLAERADEGFVPLKEIAERQEVSRFVFGHVHEYAQGVAASSGNHIISSFVFDLLYLRENGYDNGVKKIQKMC